MRPVGLVFALFTASSLFVLPAPAELPDDPIHQPLGEDAAANPDGPIEQHLAEVQQAAERANQLLYETGSNLLLAKSYVAAAEQLTKFLGACPQDEHAAEATYKLAVIALLQQKPAEARKAFERLVDDYTDSPWAELALRTHIDEKQLLALANARRTVARQMKSESDARRALRLYEVYIERFLSRAQNRMGELACKMGDSTTAGVALPTEPLAPKAEIIYKMGDCYRCAGDDFSFQTALRMLEENDKDGDWGKLAVLRHNLLKPFAKHMDELVRLDGVGDESYLAFLDLSEDPQATWPLDDDARIKCLYYRAHCLQRTKQKEQALDIYRQIVADHPESEWAPESAFQLAEDRFEHQQFDCARGAYLGLVRDWPDSPRAPSARKWAAWLNHLDKSSAALEKVCQAALDRCGTVKNNIAFTLTGGSETSNKTLEIHLAYRDNDRYLFSLHYGQSAMLLARNQDGSWYRSPEQGFVYRARGKVELPLPQVEITHDAETDQGSLRCWFGISNYGATGPLVTTAPGALAAMIRRARSGTHFRKIVHRDANGKRTEVFRFEEASWKPGAPTVTEIVLDREHVIRAVRWRYLDEKGKKTTLTLSGLNLGEDLPDEAFEFTLGDGVGIKEVDEISAWEVIGNLVRMGGVVARDARLDVTK